jgi:hypothetical protein
VTGKDHEMVRSRRTLALAAVGVALVLLPAGAVAAGTSKPTGGSATTTPIKHVGGEC